MKVKYYNDDHGAGIIKILFGGYTGEPTTGWDFYNEMGEFGRQFMQWLQGNQISYVVIEQSIVHAEFRIESGQQFVWLKMCIDERNIREKVDEFIHDCVLKE